MSDLFEPWLMYKHACVRQLAFCLASPNIIKHVPNDLEIKFSFNLHDNAFWETQYGLYTARLASLDQDPTPLLSFLEQLKSTRLGLRFEMFIWFWLLDDDYHSFQLLGHSIQQIKAQQTIGELDFLVLNTQTQQIEHWEVAIKFYLAEQAFYLNEWYGLNRQDTLQRKLSHFTQKQFQFSEALGFHIDKKYAVFKGQLYLPHHTQLNNPLPEWFNPARRYGFWGQQPIGGLYKLSRQEWFTPNADTTPQTANYWWNDGLYTDFEHGFFYMFRHTPWPTIYTKPPFFKNRLPR